MSKMTAVAAALLLLALSCGCATADGNRGIDLRDACLSATMEALELERAHVERQLRQGGTDERRKELNQRAREVSKDLQKYSTMRPEQYKLPEPILLIGRIRGDGICFLRQSRSGPFYRPVGERQGATPDVRYRLRVYLLYRSCSPFPSWYVWIEHAEKAEVVSLADYFNIQELTQINVWRYPKGNASALGERPWSSSDPGTTEKLTTLLQALPYAERPPRLDIPEDASVWKVELIRGKVVSGRLDIRGSRLCSPRATADALALEKELVEFVQRIANGAAERTGAVDR